MLVCSCKWTIFVQQEVEDIQDEDASFDAGNFMECKRMVMLNSFVEKGTKQYHSEIKKAERLLLFV